MKISLGIGLGRIPEGEYGKNRNTATPLSCSRHKLGTCSCMSTQSPRYVDASLSPERLAREHGRVGV